MRRRGLGRIGFSALGRLALAACASFLAGGPATAGPRPAPPAQSISFPCQAGTPNTPCGWTIAWETVGATTFRLPEGPQDGVAIANKQEAVGYLDRKFAIPGKAGLRLIRLSAEVKPDKVTGKGAGLTLSLVNAAGEILANHDMGYGDFGMAKGSGEWRRLEIVAAAPAEAVVAKPGLILYGPGEARFRNVRIRVSPAGTRPSRFARSYVDQAAAIIGRHSLHRGEVDLARLKADGYRIAGGARTAREAYPAIRYMIAAIGDGHSFFFSREEIAHWNGADRGPASAASPPPAMPKSRRIDRFGYVAVPGLHSGDAAGKAAFAQALQDQLRGLQAGGLEGWIVDLRANDGGNMFPMLAGLAPLFDQDELGFLVDADGRKDPWGIGAAGPKPGDGEYLPIADPLRLGRRLPIAILYGNRTGSSGEIVILSFIGNARSRSFGQKSYGLTTGNGIFPLPDGSELRLASTHMADRSGRTYEGPVEPDVVIEAKEERGKDAVLDAALAWLRGQGG